MPKPWPDYIRWTLVIRRENEAAVRRKQSNFHGIEVISLPWLDRIYAWCFRMIFRNNYRSQVLTAFSYVFCLAFEWQAWRQTRTRIKASVWDFFGCARTRPTSACSARARCRAPSGSRARGSTTPSTCWGRRGPDRVAVVARSNTRGPVELTFGELRDQVARARAGLKRLGVGRATASSPTCPNIPETLVAFLATASLGAIWASVAPEFGARSVIDRFGADRAQGPARGRRLHLPRHALDRRAEVAAITAGPADGRARDRGRLRRRAPRPGLGGRLARPPAADFAPVPFDHPLYVLFSSGTTGLPKAIVHGHGGHLSSMSRSSGWAGTSSPAGGCCGSPRPRG